MSEHITYSKITFRCRWEQPPKPIPPLVWRDRFEWQFKKICCITVKRRCEDCAVRKGCIVPFLFRPEYHFEGVLPLRGSAPLPWVPAYPAFSEEAPFALSIVLIGRKAVSQLPYWFVALDRISKTQYPRFSIQAVESETADGVRLLYEPSGDSLFTDPGSTAPRTFPGARRLRLDTLTPLRLLSGKKPLLNPRFSDIISSIEHRCRMLKRYYGEGAPDAKPDAVPPDRVHTTPIDVRWQEQNFFSKKQKETVSLSGLTGSFVFEGELEPYGELLGLGEHLGIGKGTALGLGRYAIQA